MTERRVDIQGLRGVAVSVVVLYHAGLLFDGGFLGVDMFFAISGFVITSSLMREAQANGRLSIRRFYGRRARRLLPASAVAIACAVGLSPLLGAHTTTRWTAHTALAALGFNANNYLALYGTDGGYFGPDAQSNPLLHLWSLSVEEQFYLIFPALFIAVWVRRRPRQTSAFWLLCGLAVASLVGHIYLSHIASGTAARTWSFYLAPTRAWEFLAGALAALAAARGLRLAPRWLGALTLLSGFVILLVTLLLDHPGAGRVFGPGLAVAATTVLLLGGNASATAPRGSPVTRLLRSPPLVALGDISYSWYLWHWPMIVFAHATWPFSPTAQPIAAALSLVPAWLSTQFLEQRFRRRSNATRSQMALLVVCSIALPALFAVGLRVAAPSLENLDRPSQFPKHLDEAFGCNDRRPISARPADSCIWNEQGKNGELLLVGDSNAGHFSEGALIAAQQHDLRLRIATLDSCPFVPLTIVNSGRPVAGCDDFVSDALAWIRANPPRIVVMASASDLYIGDPEISLEVNGFPATTDTATKSSYWQAALTAMLAELRDAGIPTLLIHPVPKFLTRWSPADWSAMRFWMGTGDLGVRMSTAEARVRQSRGADPERESLEAVGSRGLDLFEQVCPRPTCTAARDSLWWFGDSRHISVAASQALGSALSSAMLKVLSA